MKVHPYLFVAGVVGLLALGATPARAQEHAQFDNHDRQVTADWYNQHKNNPPRGLRPQDRLSADEEARLQPGKTLDRQLQRKTHSVPRDLARRLPPAPPHHRYQTIGGHVVLVDTRDHRVRDVIHVHD